MALDKDRYPPKEGEGSFSVSGKIRCAQKHDTSHGPVKNISVEQYLKEKETELFIMLDKTWALGFKDRGHGHGDFAVITLDTEEELVVKCSSKELAEHIIKVHNDSLIINSES